jgi:serine/threonine protein kinase
MNGVSPRPDRDLQPEPQADAARTELPQMFGPYLLVERTSSSGGPVGEAFKAIALDRRIFGRLVEVRIIARDVLESSMYGHKLAETARVAALLEHPNIARIIDFGQVSGTYFLASQHVEGRDLRTVTRALRRAHVQLRPGPVAQIAREVARGLEFAHALADGEGHPYRIVHGHVSPSAVLLGRRGGVKIAGFGIADAIELPSKVHSSRHNLPRRLRYFSPEQAREEPLDGRSDVFSLGVVMWELLTGRRLFGGTSAFECIGNVLHAPIEPPSASRPGLARELDAIVLRALERDRTARYQTAGEMAQDLEVFVQMHQIRKDAVRYILTTLFGSDPPPTAHRPPANSDADTVVARSPTPSPAARREDPTVPDWPSEPAGTAPPPLSFSAPRLPLPASLRAALATAPLLRLRLPLSVRVRSSMHGRRGLWAGTVVLLLGGVLAVYGVFHGQGQPAAPPPASTMIVLPPPPLPAPEAPTPVPEVTIQVDSPRPAAVAPRNETSAARRKPQHRPPAKRRKNR